MGKLGEAVVEVRADLRKLDGGLGLAEKAVTGFVSNANSALAGIGVAAAAGGALVLTGSALLDATLKASDFGETLSKVRTTFGKDSKAIEDTADDLAKRFGLVKRETIDAAVSIGLVGKAAGMNSHAAAGLGSEMAKLAADASSFFNVPLAEALDKFRSGLVGEAEPLRAFGVLLSEDAVKAEALRIGLVKTASAAGSLTERQKVLARVSLIKNAPSMQTAAGDLERTADSAANQLKKLQGDVENFKVQVGEHLIPALVQAVGLAEDLGHAFGEAFGTEPIAAFGQALKEAAVAARVLSTTEGLGPVLAQLKGGAAQAALGGGFGGFGSAAAGALTSGPTDAMRDVAEKKAGVDGKTLVPPKAGPAPMNAWEAMDKADADAAKSRADALGLKGQQAAQGVAQLGRLFATTAIAAVKGGVGAAAGTRAEAMAGRGALANAAGAGLLSGPLAKLLMGGAGAVQGVREQAAKPRHQLGSGQVLQGAESFANFAQVAALDSDLEKQTAENTKQTVEKLGEVAESLKTLVQKAGDKAQAIVQGRK